MPVSNCTMQMGTCQGGEILIFTAKHIDFFQKIFILKISKDEHRQYFYLWQVMFSEERGFYSMLSPASGSITTGKV
jgi:hypothetical protein